jgi:heme-degrading monooxygenase HmoA
MVAHGQHLWSLRTHLDGLIFIGLWHGKQQAAVGQVVVSVWSTPEIFNKGLIAAVFQYSHRRWAKLQVVSSYYSTRYDRQKTEERLLKGITSDKRRQSQKSSSECTVSQELL